MSGNYHCKKSVDFFPSSHFKLLITYSLAKPQFIEASHNLEAMAVCFSLVFNAHALPLPTTK